MTLANEIETTAHYCVIDGESDKVIVGVFSSGDDLERRASSAIKEFYKDDYDHVEIKSMIDEFKVDREGADYLQVAVNRNGDKFALDLFVEKTWIY